MSKANRKRKAPTTAAVCIKEHSEEFSCAEALKKAREEILMEELGITDTRVKKSANGGLIIEIPDRNGRGEKADQLRDKLVEIIGSEAYVTRLAVKRDVRVVGFDESVREDDIMVALTRLGNCKRNDLKIGKLAPMRNGLYMTWVQCPLAIAIKIAATKKIQVGWTMAKLELLEPKPIQCFKCWGYGHVRSNCRSDKTRVGNCFNCGANGHVARLCTNELSCVPCRDISKRANHRMESRFCEARILASRNKKPPDK